MWGQDTEFRELLGMQGGPIIGGRGLLSCRRWKRTPLPQDTPASCRPAILSWFLNATRSSPPCLESCPLPSPPSLSSLSFFLCLLSFFLPLPLHLFHPSHQGSHRIPGATGLCLSTSSTEHWPLRRHPPLFPYCSSLSCSLLSLVGPPGGES